MASQRTAPARARTLLAAVVLTGGLALPAQSGELIRYRRPDGSVGFAGSESSVPPGAIILTRRPASRPAADGRVPNAPDVADLVSGVRRHCEMRHGGDRDAYEYCIADQTRAGFRFRDLVLEQDGGTEMSRIVEKCRRMLERGRVPDYRKLLACAERGQAEFVERTGQHPADLREDRREPDSERKRQANEQRLRQLREDQARAERELAIGRNRWGPRYRQAEREHHDAQTKTQSILERMRQHGCRPNTLACGGLGAQLERARRSEEKKRRYLEVGIVEECRLAGCQPGWLR